ncbi:oxidoreductase [Sphaerisporangium melleum]|uniref:Oxidoreductase n=1 Tax=Sphaerisporangium melleum TaxID=321316 RepID=A0A917R348_9ACTN|nr:SDR family NAD(P)-dependent oxidoreductase [Sphaerisporangium melleum]GGK84614.1 oxidoreductase [Sphaerisporangium melleum]GII70424.1 oxidoreductase [Sphaerisporangium melleum]
MSWDPQALPDLTGRTFAVTGGNAGVGYFITEQLAAAGARVVILGRDPGRLDLAVRAVRDRVPEALLTTVALDLADLESVALAAAELNRLDRLDALIENAGVTQPGRKRRTTRQGFELAVGTNHLGHFALTALAMPVLSATPGSRVVPMGSMITKMIRFDLGDLQSERSYGQYHAYAQSKHAVQIFGIELDRRLRAAGTGMRAVIAHPGFAVDSSAPRREGINEPAALARLSAHLLAPMAHGKDRGAWPAVRAAADPDAPGGAFYGPARDLFPGAARVPREHQVAEIDRDPELGTRLWDLSQKLTGVEFPLPAARP